MLRTQRTDTSTAIPDRSTSIATPMMISILAEPDRAAIRTSTLAGQAYTVIPAIILKEGVIHPANAPKPELALASEFGRFPSGWDGRPIVLDHPKMDGIPVSANSPGIVENRAFGQIFNTQLKEDKLHTELWINNKRVEELGEEFKTNVQRLLEGNSMVEVSTGLFMQLEAATGLADGKEFQGIWRNIVPDHLAILPEGMIGACSVADGCGAPRVSGAALPPGQVAVRLGSGDFIMAQRAGIATVEPNGADRGFFKQLMTSIGHLISFRDSTGTSISDHDTRTALNAGLAKVEPDKFFWIVAIFRGTTGESDHVVYESGSNGELWSRDFSIDGTTGVITISTERTQVHPITQFLPVVIKTNNTPTPNPEVLPAMNKTELVKAIIDNTATEFTQEDNNTLMALDESVLKKIIPKVSAAPAVAEAPAAPAPVAAPAAAIPSTQSMSVQEFLEKAPVEVKSVLQSALAAQEAQKASLVAVITANTRNKFTADQLKAKGIDELQAIASLLPEADDYTGAGVARTVTANAGEEKYTPAPDIFAALAAAPAAAVRQ